MVTGHYTRFRGSLLPAPAAAHIYAAHYVIIYRSRRASRRRRIFEQQDKLKRNGIQYTMYKAIYTVYIPYVFIYIYVYVFFFKEPHEQEEIRK